LPKSTRLLLALRRALGFRSGCRLRFCCGFTR
jgi:hypothetical protein